MWTSARAHYYKARKRDYNFNLWGSLSFTQSLLIIFDDNDTQTDCIFSFNFVTQNTKQCSTTPNLPLSLLDLTLTTTSARQQLVFTHRSFTIHLSHFLSFSLTSGSCTRSHTHTLNQIQYTNSSCHLLSISFIYFGSKTMDVMKIPSWTNDNC